MNGKHIKFLHERIEDLPVAMTVAAFEPLRKKISDGLHELISKTDNPIKILNTRALMKCIDKSVKM